MTGLIVFRADWCPHCRTMERARVLEELRKLTPELSITIEDLTPGETELSKAFRVRSIPAFVLVDEESGEIKKRAIGPKTAATLAKWAAV